MDHVPRARAPRLLWIVALLGLIWNGLAVYDFVMVRLRDPHYIAGQPPAVIQMWDALPLWATAAWALSVGGGLAGSALLFPRSRLAVAAFALSLPGLAASTLHRFSVAMAPVERPGTNARTAMVWGVAVLLLDTLIYPRFAA